MNEKIIIKNTNRPVIKSPHFFKTALQKINNIIPCETHTLIVESQKRGNDFLLLFFGMGNGINDFIRHSDYESIEKTYLFLKRKAPHIRNSSSSSDFFDYDEDVKSRLLNFLPPIFSLMVKPVTLWNEKIGILLNINKKDGSKFFDEDIDLISAATEITEIAVENIIRPNEETIKSDICSSNIDREMVQDIHSDKIAALKRIAGGIAHTMNSPLTGVVTNLGMINPAEKIFSDKIDEIFHRPQFQRVDVVAVGLGNPAHRSEERRVGKECRSRWSPYP